MMTRDNWSVFRASDENLFFAEMIAPLLRHQPVEEPDGSSPV
jgi:hypothetical protein